MFNAFKKYEALSTAHFGLKISKLRCDNGGEYIANSLISYCEQQGIQTHYTTPYTPQQNGHAERMNRTFTEKYLSMLLESNVEKELWNEAIRTAAYLINRLPTTVLTNTPAEQWFGLKPDMSRSCFWLRSSSS